MSLIDRFQAFYREVLDVEQRLGTSSISPREARDALKLHLERQELAVERETGDYGADQFVRAKYAMAALADEILLRPGSPARDTWMNELLESELFRTRCAGEKVFRDIDALQGERRGDAEELARVYLAVLGLGFRGTFAAEPEATAEQKIEPYRRKLYRLIFGHEPAVEQLDAAKIVPGAYASTLEHGEQSELPYLRPWVLALAILVLFWIAAAHGLWRTSVAGIEPFVDEILALSPLVGGAP